MTSIASTSSYTNEEESSQASTSARSRLSHSSHSLESRGTHSTRGSVGSNTSRSSNTASRSTGSRSTSNRSTASRSSRSSTSSSRYSRTDHKTREQDETARRLSTIHSVTSEQSQEECSNSDFSQYSTTSSTTNSNTLSHASSSNRAELSLPSSFGGSAYRNNTTRALVKQDDGVVSIATQDAVSIKSDAESSSSLNTETQLALRVEKETKSMMHLVKLLKEMDPGSDDNGISKNNAIHSLIEEFEEEVVEIKQRITNPMLTNGETGDSEEMQEMMEELPPDWIALVDPDSGDVYYSNEVTGETTWDKPEMPKQLQDEDSYNESYNSRDDSQDSYNSNYEEESADEEDENGELPPDWVALEDVDSGDIYYANEVTGETTWDRPKMTKEDRQRMQQEFDGDQQQRQQQQQPQPQSQEPQMNTDINNASNLSYDYQPSNPKEVHQQPADDEISADGSLPSDWIPLVDPDSGDTYFCNEVTGETSWDPPQFEKEEKKRRKNKATKRSEQQQQEEEEYEIRHDGEDTAAVDDTEQEDLPEGWFSIVDPDSGDVYYSNEITGETTWDKPISENEPNLPENDTNHQTQFHQEQNSNFNRSESNTSESTDTALPPGWVVSIDPDSGNEYYFNEETGETTWDKPISENVPENDTSHQTQFHQEQNSNFNRSKSTTSESTDKDLPPGWVASIDPDSGNEYYFNEETGETTWDKPEYQQIEQQLSNSSADFSESACEWFPVVDPQSGDTYYANERTGETSWEKPEALLRLENQPHNNSGQDKAPLLTNSPANNENTLPPGWFAAIDTQSGNEYYVNEQTGETTWDKPSVTHTPLLSNQPASEDENSLASGWFAVVEPTSGDIYYANEQTGATSWEKPRKQNNTNINNHSSLQSFHRNDSRHNQSSHGLSKMSLSMHENTVYESDSVTSSQY